MSKETVAATEDDKVLADALALGATGDGNPAPVINDSFEEGFDFFAEFDGGVDSGIEDMYRRKFAAGLNKDCRFLGLTWESKETFKVVKARFMNDDNWEEDFPIFVPDAREFTDKEGNKKVTWFPDTMRDVNAMPITDNAKAKHRAFGGVKDLTAEGRVQRFANGEVMYRNETETEAKKRQLNDFRCKLNSFLACYCKDNMKEAMQSIVDQGPVTGWDDYMARIQGAITKFAPEFKEDAITLKLHRRYDKTTSNKCSERYFELPKDMSYGLFMEKEVDPALSVITVSAYEEKKKIAAPTKGGGMSAGVQGKPGGPTGPKAGGPGKLPGMPSGLPKAGGMPKLPKK